MPRRHRKPSSHRAASAAHRSDRERADDVVVRPQAASTNPLTAPHRTGRIAPDAALADRCTSFDELLAPLWWLHP